MGAKSSTQNGPIEMEKPKAEPKTGKLMQAEEARAIELSLRLDEGPRYRIKRDSSLSDSKDSMRSVCADLAKLRIQWSGETPYDQHIRLLEFIEESAQDSKSEFLTWLRRYGGGRSVESCLQAMQNPKTPEQKAMRNAYVTMMPALQQINKDVLQALSDLSRNFEVKCDMYATLRSHVRELEGLIEEWTKAKEDSHDRWECSMHPINVYPDDLHKWTSQELLKYKIEQRDFIASKLDGSCLKMLMKAVGSCLKMLMKAVTLLRPLIPGFVMQ